VDQHGGLMVGDLKRLYEYLDIVYLLVGLKAATCSHYDLRG